MASDDVARPEGRLKLGLLMASIAQNAGGLSDAEADRFNTLRDKTPDKPMRFE